MQPTRMSTRNRGEPPIKKRALSPPVSSTPVATPKSAVSHKGSSKSVSKAAGAATSKSIAGTNTRKDVLTDVLAESNNLSLPVKILNGQPIPILREPQERHLSLRYWQSISESHVLASALERSRQKWISGDHFERFWTKPSKKKAVTSDLKQPGKESMSRIGSCSLVIEPHSFDIVLYSVRDSPKASFQTGSYKKTDVRPSPAVTQHSALQLGENAIAPVESRLDGSGSLCAPIDNTVSSSLLPSKIDALDTRTKEASSTDPVIQMLAVRAASNTRLKGLMKIVASGNALPEQVREFQSHIDELNLLLQSSRENIDTNTDTQQENSSMKARSPAVAAGSGPTMAEEIKPSHNSVDTIGGTHITGRPVLQTLPMHRHPTIDQAGNNPSSQYHQVLIPNCTSAVPGSATKSKSAQLTAGKIMQNKSEIASVVFDFANAGDRFRFPKYSILEYLPGGLQVLVSFLIICRHESNEGKAGIHTVLRPDSDCNTSKVHYQTVTMRLIATHSRILESLSRVVAPPDEVRAYMEGIFDSMIAAPRAYLPFQLPRVADLVPLANDAVHTPVIGAIGTNSAKIMRTQSYAAPSVMASMHI